MKRKAKWIAGGVVGVILLLGALAMFVVPGEEQAATDVARMVAPDKGAPQTLIAPESGVRVGGGSAASKALPQTGAAGVPAPAAAPSLPNGSTASGQADASGWSNLQLDQKIIKNAVLSVVAKDVNHALDQVSDIIAAYPSAFISNSNVRQRDDKTEASIVVKVAAADFDGVMKQLRQIGEKVTSENISTQDVTEEYVDLESQLRNLKATQERYLQLLAKAVTVQDILSIQERLNNVQSQIDRTEGRIKFLDQRTSFSTITINMAPTPGALPGKPSPWDPAKTFSVALGNLMRVSQGFLDAAIYLSIYSLPLLPLLVFAWWLFRRRTVRTVFVENGK